MIRSGIGFPSRMDVATMAMITGSAAAAFPAANLADLRQIRTIFKASASGAIAFKATLSANASVEFLALVHHNAVDGATYRFRTYSDDTLSTLVDDSGTLTFADYDGSQFAKVTPYALPAAVSARAIRVDLSDISTPWRIGGLEASGLWAFEEVARRERGISARDAVTALGDGSRVGTRMFSPRTIGTGRVVDLSDEGLTVLDFLNSRGKAQPFVWARSLEEASTWPREAVLVTNSALKPLSKDHPEQGAISLDLREHLL